MNLVGRNLLWLLISQLATWGMSLVVILVVPTYLGSEGFGAYSFAGAYVGFFQLAAGLGTSILLAREVARDHSIVGSYVFNAVVLKLVLATVLSSLALLGGILLRFSGETLAIVAVCCVGMFAFVLNEVLFSALAGMQRMGKSSAWAVITVYVASISGILVLANDGGVVAYAAVLTIASVIPVIANGVLLWPLVRQHLHLDAAVWKLLVRGGLPLMLLTVFNQIYNTIDIPILAAIAGTTTVGWYALAYKWAGIPIFIANAVMGSYYPELSIHGKTGGPRFAELVNQAIKLVLLVSVPAGIGLAVVAADLIDLLYDPEFRGSVRPLQILALQLPITSMDTILATALIASDRLRKYLVVAGAAAALNPVVCIVAIHLTVNAYDNGAIGAAIATAMTELFVMGCGLALSAPGVMNASMVSWSLRCVLAGASIVLVGVFAGGTHLVVQVILGIGCYAIASLLLGTITMAFVRQALQRATGVLRPLRQRGADKTSR